jgi:hypothetical protein
MADLKALITEGDDRVIIKLVHFGSSITGTQQNLSHKADQALAFIKFVRLTSHDKASFQTFSAAYLHWPDLHRLLPGSEGYLGKRVVKKDIYLTLTEEEKQQCICSTDDHLQRAARVKDNGNVVDFYFHLRLHMLLDHVGKVMNVHDYIIRYEAQARGTIHAHLLLRIKVGPSHSDLENAKAVLMPNLPEVKQAEIAAAQEKTIKFACNHIGVCGVHPNPDPADWPGPFGQDVYTPDPEHNILRLNILDIEDDQDHKSQHERMVNRCMLHGCKAGFPSTITTTGPRSAIRSRVNSPNPRPKLAK